MPVGVYGAAAELLAIRYRGRFTTYSRTVGALLTPLIAASGNGERVWLAVINPNTFDVRVGLRIDDLGAVVGFLISGQGGYIAFDTENDGMLPTREWYVQVVPGGLAEDVEVVEMVRDTALPAE